MPFSLCFRSSLAAIVLLLPHGATFAEDGDWSQWRGPNRDGYAAKQSLLKAWPEEGPNLVWSFDAAGLGYSSVAVVGDDLFTMGKRDQNNLLLCMDAKTGKEKWASLLGPAASSDSYLTGWGDGPRCTPTVHGDLVFALCDLGSFGCFRRSDGEKVWSVHLVNDLGGSVPKWGYSESALIDGDRVMITPGGSSYMVGLDINTGKKTWTTEFSEGANYVSIIKHTFEGVPVYLSACRQGLVGIHCETGELLFKNDATKNDIAVIGTPIVSENVVYHSAAYGSGNSATKVMMVDGKLEASKMYHNPKESMANHHGGNILKDGAIFGFSKDLRGVWMAQDLETGKVLWSKKIGRATSGSIACADGLLYCYDDQDGICYLVMPDRSGWKELGKVKLPETTSTERNKGAIWAHPVIAKQMLLIRDQEKIFAFDIASK
jgi:outer membrane protein assembly factor BamB